MKRFLLFLTLFFVTVTFNGCDDTAGISSTTSIIDDENTTTQPITFYGVVADGYIDGATVCLDLNLNQSCDYEEPTALTNETGVYSFSDVDISDVDFFNVIASGGVDTATGENFVGELFSVVERANFSDSSIVYITPLTDLVASFFLNSSTKASATLQTALAKIAYAFSLDSSLVRINPMEYAGIFGLTQEIQQIKHLIEALALKTKAVSLTSVEMKQLRREIKFSIVSQINDNATLDYEKVLLKLEDVANLEFNEYLLAFVVEQLENIKISLDAFTQENTSLTQENLNSYQALLEVEEAKAVSLINASTGLEALESFAVEINPFSEDNSTVSTDENVTTEESNATTLNFDGVMVDGYISGATICTDLDLNGLCGGGEAISVTDENGSFSFSNLSAEIGSYFSLIGYGGVDTATGNSFEKEYKTIVSVDENLSSVMLNPMTDLASLAFSEYDAQTALAFTTATSTAANILGVEYDSIHSDPMKDNTLFVKSQFFEQSKKILENMLMKYIVRALSASEKSVLQAKVKKSLYDYELNLEDALIKLETDYALDISSEDRKYVVSLAEEMGQILDDSLTSTEIVLDTLPRFQEILESRIDEVYDNGEREDLNLTIEKISYSIFSKVNAQFDSESCMIKGDYQKLLIVQADSKESDTANGLSLYNLYEVIDENETKPMELYYSNIGVALAKENVVVDGETFKLVFDSSWSTKQMPLYIKTPLDDDGKYGCYKIEPRENTGAIPIKVFRYTDM